VYLNGSEEPLGKSGPQPLRSGDTLRLGGYQIRVAVDTETGPHPDPSVIVPFAPTSVPTGAGAAERDIGVELDLRELLAEPTPAGQSSGKLRPVNAFGQPVFDDSGIRAVEPPSGPPPARTPPPRRESRTPAVADNGAESFCRGAGIDAQNLLPEQQQRMLHLAGILLREVLVGAKGLVATQRKTRRLCGLNDPPQDAEREVLQRMPVEDLLLRLLTSQDQHTLDPVQWLRELFALASRHDAALARALRSALGEFTQRLAPEALGDTRSATGRFRNLIDMPQGQLPHLFAEALAHCFDQEMQHPASED
jgi:predicted component of type VI protein secretion system